MCLAMAPAICDRLSRIIMLDVAAASMIVKPRFINSTATASASSPPPGRSLRRTAILGLAAETEETCEIPQAGKQANYSCLLTQLECAVPAWQNSPVAYPPCGDFE